MLEGQLSEIAKKDEHVPNDYDAKFPNYGDEEEQNATEVADYDVRLDLEAKMEVQLVKVKKALKKMGEGTYGICEKTGKEIPLERLKAIPWAETIADADKEDTK
ncbi:TraR/DksA C4-type zinc finger protein [Patescibacteria group bacterium]|nr:TraR/DksA C4-type zinc finger protein [Patescibacteria group bacterium]